MLRYFFGLQSYTCINYELNLRPPRLQNNADVDLSERIHHFNEYSIAVISFGTAANEPTQVRGKVRAREP